VQPHRLFIVPLAAPLTLPIAHTIPYSLLTAPLPYSLVILLYITALVVPIYGRTNVLSRLQAGVT